jgi:hypothetical protein
MELNERQKASRKRAKWLAEFKATLSDDELNYESLKGMGLNDSDIAAVLGAPIIVDAEVVEVEDDSSPMEPETPNLPAVIEQAWNGQRMENQSGRKREYQAKPNRTADGRSTDAENVAAYNQSLESNAERRCTATNAKGERCRKYAIFGSNVCKTHGGATRQVVSTARMRVEMASNRLMGKLIEFAFDDDKPAHVQLEAIKDSLNRAGLKPREQLEVGPIKQYEEIFDDIGSGTRVESRRARGIDDESDEIEGQHDSYPFEAPENSPESFNSAVPQADSPPLTRDGQQRQYGPESTDSDDVDDRDGSHRQRPERRSTAHSAVHITGEDAIRIANAVNMATGALKALPPGRSAG